MQTEFIAQYLSAWLEASGRSHDINSKKELDASNVVYQGRILVSVIDLIPAAIWKLKKSKHQFVSDKAVKDLTTWFTEIIKYANLFDKNIFINKTKFKQLGYLGSGGIGRFKNSLWAVINSKKKLGEVTDNKIAELADKNKKLVFSKP